MATAKEKAHYATLRAVLAQFPRGASLEQISSAAALHVSERTLIRRLAQMVADGVVRKEGVSRAARYVLCTSTMAGAGWAEEEPRPIGPRWPRPQVTSVVGGLAEEEQALLGAPDSMVPFSAAGAEIKGVVTRPIQARKTIGYNRAFLSGYKPNRTTYLTGADRARLTSISRTVDAADPRAGTYARRILNRLLIDLAWNSSRLEGNTYSLLDTQRLIEAGEAAEGKAATETQMILNHKAAIEFLVEGAEEIDFNRYTILNLHALLAENLLPSPTAEGRIRQIRVGIGGSAYRPPDVPQVLNECFDEVLAKAQAIDDPFEQAFFVMVQLPYLQPFEDVNKRVSRLAANIPLIRRNLAPIAFVDVPDDTYVWGMLGVYELNRIELLRDVFLWAYERSAARYAAIRQTTGEPDQFRLHYRDALKQVVAEVIRKPMDQKDAAAHIAAWSARHLPETERARFVEIAETELMSLHEGSFARYRVRPTEFYAWQAVWQRRA